MTPDYRVVDRSILLPHYERWVWRPLLRLIPRSIPANALTWTGVAANAAAVALAAARPPGRLGFLLLALLVFAYLCLDGLDGMQARRAGTAGPLGELHDHWLDSLNSVAVFLVGALVWQLMDARGLAMVAAGSFAFSITFWEQRLGGTAYFGRIGALEGLTVSLALFLTAALLGPEAVLGFRAFGLTGPEWIVASAVLGCALTAVGPIARLPRHAPGLLWLLVPLAAAVAWHALAGAPAPAVAPLILLLTPAAAGRFVIARVTRAPGLGPNRVAHAAVALAAAVSLLLRPDPAVQTALAGALLLYMALAATFDFAAAIRALRTRAPRLAPEAAP